MRLVDHTPRSGNVEVCPRQGIRADFAAAAGEGGPASACLIVGTVLLHVAIFPLNVLISTGLFALAPDARSRVNTARVTTNFIAAAIGSAAVGPLWSTGGWTAVAWAGVVVSAVGLAVWAVGRRGALVMPGPVR